VAYCDRKDKTAADVVMYGNLNIRDFSALRKRQSWFANSSSNNRPHHNHMKTTEAVLCRSACHRLSPGLSVAQSQGW